MTNNNPPRTSAGGTSRGTRSVRDDMHRTVDDARKGAADRVEGIADSIDAAADHLDDEDMSRLSGYVHDMASTLGELAQDLQRKSGDEMLRDVKQMAHRNPALFLGGSVALGFGMSRFARATRARERQLPVPMDQARADTTPNPITTPPEYGDMP